MNKIDIPVSSRQMLYLALVIALPLVFSLAVLAWAPPKPGQSPSASIVAAGIVAAVALGLLGLFVAMMKRHAIEITRETLVVRHSLYTLSIERASVTAVSVQEVASVNQLGLSTKSNGIAAFGYFSGWFRAARGEPVFCAISARPLYLITFEGSTPCRQLAISTSLDVANRIAEWGAA